MPTPGAPPTGRRPTIPDAELRRRPAALGELLAQAAFDGWVAYGDDRAVFGPDHVRYLTDLEPHFEPVVLAGRAGAAGCVLLTGPETVGYAAVVTAHAAVREIVAIDELAHPEEEYPTIATRRGADILCDLFSGVGRIALLGCGAMPRPLWRELLGPLIDRSYRIAAGDDQAYRLRSIKTAAEHAVIDEAYRIASLGLAAAAGAIRPGAVEREVAAAAEAAMRAAGAEGFGIDTMVASGVANTAPILARSTFRAIGRSDLVTVTLAPRYEGYHAALARAFLFERNAPVEAAIDAARRGQRVAAELLVAGREGRKACAALQAVLDEAQTGAELPYVPVHTIGLIEFEPPIFLSRTGARIEEGMALSIDAALFHGPWGGLRLEDGFAIRGGRAQPRLPGYEELVPVML